MANGWCGSAVVYGCNGAEAGGIVKGCDDLRSGRKGLTRLILAWLWSNGFSYWLFVDGGFWLCFGNKVVGKRRLAIQHQ
ncbi:DUF3577 domain-containing protein [Sesbania bispinosa]|nr:DUF3577 domain-containing protein [Sesbania bispinosa]